MTSLADRVADLYPAPTRRTTPTPATRTLRRTAGYVIRSTDTTPTGRYIAGRAVPYSTPQDVGGYLETHQPGSFTTSITRTPDVPLLLWHNNQSFPVGVTDKWNDNPDGLDVIWRLDTSDEAQRAAQLARDGILTGLSIGFVPIRSKWTYAPKRYDPDTSGPEHLDRVTRLESRLLEISIVSTPAYAAAKVTKVY